MYAILNSKNIVTSLIADEQITEDNDNNVIDAEIIEDKKDK